MDAFVLFGKWFWALCLAAMLINVIIFRSKAARQIEKTPELAPGYRTIIKGFMFWGSIPWLVMGVGCTVGGIPSVWDYFRPGDANPYVLAFFATVVLLWAIGTYWLFFRGGAEMLVRHPGLLKQDFKSPKTVKAWWLLGLAGGVVAVVLMFVHPVPKPLNKSGTITHPGYFASPDGAYTLTVSLTPSKIVAYSVKETATGKQVFVGNAGSIRQRWYFLWDTTGNLWVHSSDIGGCVWMRQQGKFAQHVFELGKRLPTTMPHEFRQHLPDSLKRLDP